MKKSIQLAIALAMSGALIVVPASYALAMEDDTTAPSKTTRDDTVEAVKSARTELDAVKKQELESKRAAIEQKIAEKRAAVVEKLSGKRAERCQQKQAKINQTLDKRVDAAQRHFDKFKAIQDKLAAFVEKKNLPVENALPLERIMNDRQTEAQAAIDAVKGIDFNCANADSSAPGKIVIEQVAAVKQSLKDYRTAIKNYAIAVKSAAATAEQPKTESTEGAEQ